MTSTAQVIANRKNAMLSTGPKTPEGKSAAARNSIKHGLSGAFHVLANEDQEEYDCLLARLRCEFAPASEHEAFLVEQMAQSRWRLARIRRIETAVLDRMMENGIDTEDLDRRIAARFLMGGEQSLTALHRYASAAERSYYKAYKELMAARQFSNAQHKTAREVNGLHPVSSRLYHQAPFTSVQNEPNLLPVPAPKSQMAAGGGNPLSGHRR